MIILCVTRTGDGSLFYPVQGRDVDMDYKTYPFVYDNKIRQAVAVALYALITTLVLAIITVMGVMLWLVLAPTIFHVNEGAEGSLAYKVFFFAGIIAIFLFDLYWFVQPFRKQYTVLGRNSVLIHRNVWLATQLLRGIKDQILFSDIEKFDIPDNLDEFKHDPLPCVVTNPSHVVRIWTRKSVFPYYVITDQADAFVVELSKRINGE